MDSNNCTATVAQCNPNNLGGGAGSSSSSVSKEYLNNPCMWFTLWKTTTKQTTTKEKQTTTTKPVDVFSALVVWWQVFVACASPHSSHILHTFFTHSSHILHTFFTHSSHILHTLSTVPIPFSPIRFVLFGLFLHPTQRVVLYLIVQQRFTDFHVTKRHQRATGAHLEREQKDTERDQ
jgi:hypothetical protein